MDYRLTKDAVRISGMQAHKLRQSYWTLREDAAQANDAGDVERSNLLYYKADGMKLALYELGICPSFLETK